MTAPTMRLSDIDYTQPRCRDNPAKFEFPDRATKLQGCRPRRQSKLPNQAVLGFIGGLRYAIVTDLIVAERIEPRHVCVRPALVLRQSHIASW